MSFSVMLDLLKQKSKGSIVLVRLGAFYVAVGEDNYDKTTEELNLVSERVGRSKKETNQNINCMLCKGVDCIEKIYKDDTYIKAFSKLMESDKT